MKYTFLTFKNHLDLYSLVPSETLKAHVVSAESYKWLGGVTGNLSEDPMTLSHLI